jgi:HAD superfamily hydrolase (TIGR01459 family)
VFFRLLLFLSSLLAAGKMDCTPIPSFQNAQTTCLKDLAMHYDAFLLDAYGVFWGSSEVGVLPGAADAMRSLVDQGKYVAILSNSTQLALREKEKFRKHGLQEGVHYHFLLTSGELARSVLQEEALPFSTPRHTYWVFGSVHPRFGSHLQIFEGTRYREVQEIEKADFIYIAIPHINGVDQEDPEVFRHPIQALPQQTPVLCVNPDRFAMEGSPPKLVVRQGSLAALFEEENFPVYFIGKPSKRMYQAALKLFPSNLPKEKILMIGDTPETDIRGAYMAGLDAALVTKTGTMSLLNRGQLIDQLPTSDQPRFLLERFQE